MKKGVKRKADTTTPTATVFDYNATLESKTAKISTRRESGRQIKKPSRPELDGLVAYHKANISPMLTNLNTTPQHASLKAKEKLSEALKSCNEILKELFTKKHSVSWLLVRYINVQSINVVFYRVMRGLFTNL